MNHKKNLIIGILILSVLLITGGVFSKYLYENNGRNLLASKEFYFTSDLLMEDDIEYVLNSTTTSVSFVLRNSVDKLRISEADIRYTVTAKKKGENNGATVDYDDKTKKLRGDSLEADKITIKGLEPGETYVVTATGTAGYEKELKAEFKVTDKAEIVYKHLDTGNEGYVLLTVWTENAAGTLKVTFPEGLVPNNADPVLREVYSYKDSAYKGGDFSDADNFKDAYASYTYQFFIAEENTLTVNDFSVSIAGNDAVNGILK